MKKKKVSEQSTNEYINLADVRGEYLYTKDNYIFQFLKVQPISTALMTKDEKKFLTAKMTAEISPIGIPFKILFLSRPTDVKQIIDYYEGMKSMTVDIKKRENLTKTIRYFSKMATSGGVLERQTFICLWMKKDKATEEDLLSKTLEFKNALINAGVTASLCNEAEIVNMLSLFYNPMFINTSDIDKTFNFTFMEDN